MPSQTKPNKPTHMGITSPTGGLVRRYSYQQQPPYTTPDCLNVRPFDPLEGRERCGSRPGLAKALTTQFGSGNPIQALASVTVADDDATIRDVLVVVANGVVQYTDSTDTFQSPIAETTLIDSETGDGGFEDAAASWTDAIATTTYLYRYGSGNIARVTVADASDFTEGQRVTITGTTGDSGSFNSTTPVTVTQLDFSNNYVYYESEGTASFGGADTGGTFYGVEYSLSSGNWTWVAGSGEAAAEVDAVTSGSYAARLTYDTGEAYGYQDASVTAGAVCTLSFSSKGDGSVAGRYGVYDVSNSADIVSTTSTGHTGSTWAKTIVEFDVPVGCSSVRIYLRSPSSAGDAYFDDVELTHRVDVTGASVSTTLDTISVVGMLQKVYFADALENNISGTRGTVLSSVLSDPDVSDWTALGLSTSTDFVTVTAALTTELYEVSRSVEEIHEDYVVLSGRELAEGPVVFDIERADLGGDDLLYVGNIDVEGVSRFAYSAASITDWTAKGLQVGESVEISYISTSTSLPVTFARYITHVNETYLCLDNLLANYDGEGTTWVIARPDAEGLGGSVGEDNQLSSAEVDDWTQANLGEGDTIVLNRDETGYTGGKFKIASIAAGGLTLDTDDVPDGSDYSYQIGRNIKSLDPDTGVLGALEESEGISPLNCHLLCSYRGRLVAVFKNTWFMSRQNDPTDWDYGADDQDTARAVAGGVSEAADVPDPITAVIPHTDDYLLFACPGSLWMMRGDPAMGGQLDQLSDEIGIIGRTAWCKLPDGMLVFLSRAGIYILPPGGNGYPVPFSDERVPQELLDVDAESNIVTMQYDANNQGVHLFITPTNGTAGEHWWIDWRLKGLWPVSLPISTQPYSVLAYASDASEDRKILLGGGDGYLREFATTATTDDGTAFESYVQLGPFSMAPPPYEGMVTEISCVMDDDSADVSWELRVGQTGEAAVDSTTAKASGTWSGGWNRPTTPRVRGSAGSLYVEGSGDPWAIEIVNLALMPVGRMR